MQPPVPILTHPAPSTAGAARASASWHVSPRAPSDLSHREQAQRQRGAAGRVPWSRVVSRASMRGAGGGRCEGVPASHADEEAPVAQRDGGHVRSGDVPGGRRVGGAGSASEGGGTAGEGSSGAADAGEAGPSGIPEEAFPQSWPPASHRSHMPTVRRRADALHTRGPVQKTAALSPKKNGNVPELFDFLNTICLMGCCDQVAPCCRLQRPVV